MEGNARIRFTPKQKAELWELWKSGQCVADIAERLRGGTRAASIGSWLSMVELLQRHGGELRSC